MLIGIKNLNSGYLTHHILDPQVLTKYLEIIEDDLEETAPEYKPVFTSVYQYYGNSLASFTNTIDDLLLQLPIWIKLKVQVPMSLDAMTFAQSVNSTGGLMASTPMMPLHMLINPM